MPGVPPYTLFLRQAYQKAEVLACPSIPERGRMLGQMYRNLPAEERAALVEAAKTTTPQRRVRVPKSVLALARERNIPTGLVKREWFRMKDDIAVKMATSSAQTGTATKMKNTPLGVLEAIAEANNLKVRKPKKDVANQPAKPRVTKKEKKAARKLASQNAVNVSTAPTALITVVSGTSSLLDLTATNAYDSATTTNYTEPSTIYASPITSSQKMNDTATASVANDTDAAWTTYAAQAVEQRPSSSLTSEAQNPTQEQSSTTEPEKAEEVNKTKQWPF